MSTTFRILPLIALAACASSSAAPSSSTSSTSSAASSSNGAETTSSNAATATTTPGAPAGSVDADSTSAAPAHPSRATLVPGRLATCTPEGASVTHGTPVSVRLEPAIGGCRLMPPAPDPSAPNVLELNVLGGPSRVAEIVSCAPGTTPNVDFRANTYATFLSTHRSNERWEVAFAVDDGERVHIGLQPRGICQGVAPTTGPDLEGLTIATAGRAVMVHRCEGVVVHCPAVP